MYTPLIAQLYDYVLATGAEGRARYLAGLQARGIEPEPTASFGNRNLYTTNPVLLPAPLVAAMLADANAFLAHLRASVSSGEALLARAPELVRTQFASPEVAARLVADWRITAPLVSLDAFLVETPAGLDRAYIEWQTVGSYISVGRWPIEAAIEAWPRLAEHASLTATPGVGLADLIARLRALYLRGIEDDPRTGVVMDYLPRQQPTRHEFRAMQEITGGPEHGLGVIDPREVVLVAGAPHYRRSGSLIPIRRGYSRLVYSEMIQLHAEADDAQRAAMRRLFSDGEQVSWVNHPLHFFYGSKADFPAFSAAGLSAALPETVSVTAELVHRYQAELGGDNQLRGFVQKPTDLQSGKDVVLDPYVSDLRVGCVLQREIRPAAYHRTLFGPRTPEVRLMCLPGDDDQLMAGLVYNRVKDPGVFLSNAGAIAGLRIPGTGEGYALVIAEPAAC